MIKKRENKLTVLIITLNEIEQIDDLILNVSFADEIIVVDSFSVDGTVEAVKKYQKVRLIQNEFVNFSNQRNFALKHASNAWSLFVDADERLSIALIDEIQNVIENPEDVVAFGFYRNFYFKGVPIKYSGYQSDKVYRLFRKDQVVYDQNKFVHETIIVNGNSKLLKNKLDHFSYTDEDSFKGKLLKYGELRALELFRKGLKPNFFHFYIKPAYRFLNHFLIRSGFLDGKKGYVISRLNAWGVKQRYIELQKMYDIKV